MGVGRWRCPVLCVACSPLLVEEGSACRVAGVSHVVSCLSSFTAPLSVVCVPSALSRVWREWGCRRAHAAVSPPCR